MKPQKDDLIQSGPDTLVCGGDYFDWPLWKRVASTILQYPYSHYAGIRAIIHKRLYGSPLPYKIVYWAGYAIANTEIRPIWYTQQS